MIDLLQKIAAPLRPLRYPALIMAAACLAVLGIIVLAAPAAGEHNRYVAPAIVGFIWFLSAYGFIDGFQSVPEHADRQHGFFTRIRLYLLRGWFWVLALVFAASTLAALILTFKLGSVWLSKY